MTDPRLEKKVKNSNTCFFQGRVQGGAGVEIAPYVVITVDLMPICQCIDFCVLPAYIFLHRQV